MFRSVFTINHPWPPLQTAGHEAKLAASKKSPNEEAFMKGIGIAVAAGVMLLAPAAIAQDTPIIFGQYYRCNQAMEGQTDEIVRSVVGPIIEKHVAAGHLTGWVWLAHSQGGPWRRLLATVGTDLGTMMDVRQEMVEELTTRHADALQQVGSACGSHDDYIWTGISTSTPDPDAVGPATLSTYYACDNSREGRTNQIFQDVLAPLFQKHQEMGHIASWGFYAHRSGGIFRRLATFSGPDHKTLFQMQQAINQEANQTNPLAMNEFREICSWHTDYLWNNITNP